MKGGKILMTGTAVVLAFAGIFAGKPKPQKLATIQGYYRPAGCVSVKDCTTVDPGGNALCKLVDGPNIITATATQTGASCVTQQLFTLNP